MEITQRRVLSFGVASLRSLHEKTHGNVSEEYRYSRLCWCDGRYKVRPLTPTQLFPSEVLRRNHSGHVKYRVSTDDRRAAQTVNTHTRARRRTTVTPRGAGSLSSAPRLRCAAITLRETEIKLHRIDSTEKTTD